MEHEWILLIECPVGVIFDGQGEPTIFVDPDARKIAEDGAQYGCRNCDASIYEKDKQCQTVPQ